MSILRKHNFVINSWFSYITIVYENFGIPMSDVSGCSYDRQSRSVNWWLTFNYIRSPGVDIESSTDVCCPIHTWKEQSRRIWCDVLMWYDSNNQSTLRNRNFSHRHTHCRSLVELLHEVKRCLLWNRLPCIQSEKAWRIGFYAICSKHRIVGSVVGRFNIPYLFLLAIYRNQDQGSQFLVNPFIHDCLTCEIMQQEYKHIHIQKTRSQCSESSTAPTDD